MLAILLFHAALLGAPDADAVDTAGKHVEFLGFSPDNALCAWRVRVARRQEGRAVDHFALVRVVRVHDNRLVETFRDAPIWRSNFRGRHVAVSGAQLGHDNADWHAAAPQAAWARFARHTPFALVRFDFLDNLLRLLPDEDAGLLVPKRVGKSLMVAGRQRQPLGYAFVVRLFEGQYVPLGHFRTEASYGQAHAEINMYHSRDGRAVAVLNRFVLASGEERSQALVSLTPQNNPIASTRVGTLRFIREQQRSMSDDFAAMHPDKAAMYEAYVGEHF